jgi:hypothetical protein
MRLRIVLNHVNACVNIHPAHILEFGCLYVKILSVHLSVKKINISYLIVPKNPAVKGFGNVKTTCPAENKLIRSRYYTELFLQLSDGRILKALPRWNMPGARYIKAIRIRLLVTAASLK